MNRPTSRHRILVYLREHPGASAAQIGRGLNMRPASIRFHLAILLGDGRIATMAAPRKVRRGRPPKAYRLSEMQRGHNLAALLGAALGWLEGQSAPRRRATYEALAADLASQMSVGNPGVLGSKRLAAVVERLNGFHYEATWEAGSEGPRILLGHCPYAAVINEHPELCQIDARMLALGTSGAARQIAKIDAGPGGASHCIFSIR